MSDSDRAAYMEANANNPEFGKHVNGGVVDLGSLKVGDRVGFYEVRPNGGTYTHSTFKEWKDQTWLAFDKNDNHGKDEWLSIAEIAVQEADGNIGALSGAPLPGILAILLVGGTASLALVKKR